MNNTQWKPFSEHPEVDITVLTCSDDGGHPQSVSFCRYDGKRWVDIMDDGLVEPVFDYWMYIPELPKKVKA